MEEITTINRDQILNLEAIIGLSANMLRKYQTKELTVASIDAQITYHQLAREEEYRLSMAYKILKILGLKYNSGTDSITVIEETQ